ncbi:MAG: PAS domain S-box protein [Gemmatimonadales bacterium]
MSETTPPAGTRVRRPWLTLRAVLFALPAGAVLYVGAIAAYVIFELGPTTTALQQLSGIIAREYQATHGRVMLYDSVRTEVGRVVALESMGVPMAPSLPGLRARLQATQDSVSSLQAALRLRDVPDAMRVALANATQFESSLAATMLDAIAAIELGDRRRAEADLRQADSIATRLDRVLANATALALRDVGERESGLAASARTATRALGLWVSLGVILLPLLLYYLHIRVHRPLTALDRSLDRVMAGDLRSEVRPSWSDELGRVSAHFNEMIAVLRERDALERRLAADRTRARTRLMLDAALDAVIAIDDHGHITEWNPQSQAIFGWGRDEVLGRELAETIIPEPMREAHREGLARYLALGEARVLNQRLEMDALTRNGDLIPVELAITPIAQPEGKVGFSAFLRDISSRRAAEAALRESEERYRAAFEQAGVGMAELGPDARYLRVNRTFCEIVGYDAEELVGHPLSTVTHPADVLQEQEVFTQVAAGDLASVSRERRYLRKDGTGVWAQVTLSPVRDGTGAVAHLLKVTQDITARKRLEEELRQSQKLDAVGRLAGGVAHDFNNLLTGIIGYADLLRQASDASPQLRQDAEAILLAARRGADLTRNLLTFARRSATRAEPVDLHATILEVVELLERTFDRRIEIRLKLSARPSTLLGDHSQLANSVLNLALNARDAMPQGGSLAFATSVQMLEADFCSRHADLTPGRHLVLTVSDTGIGMPPETVARAFEPFFTTKPPGKGTGLGLAMVYGTIKAHRGLVTVASQPGAGTTFTVYLPLTADEVKAPATNAARPVRGAGRVLLVDDEQVIRDLARRMLERVGYTVETAGNGVEAVERVRQAGAPYDVIVLDWNMPRMGGREACRAIRAVRPDARIVLASGVAETAMPEDLARDGFSGVVQKPYNLAELSRVVAEQLDRGPTARR